MDLNHLTRKVSRYMSSQAEYSGILNMTNPVEKVRLELTTLCLQSIRSCHLSYNPIAELAGLEPTTLTLTA